MLLKSTPSFEKAYRRFVRRHPLLRQKIDGVLRQLEDDIDSPLLHTHKLSGRLQGLSACACGYDCRIIFSVEKEAETGNELIVLIDMGTHDEVY